MAKRRVPKVFYDYVDCGSWTEATYHANERDLASLTFHSRVVRDLANRNLATTLAGQAASMPVAIAPTGMAGMQFPDGEIHAARAAHKAGVPYTLSSMSICSMEDVAKHAAAPFWFQTYIMQDRDFMFRMIDRAAALGCPALVVSLDLQTFSQRHKDIKNKRTASVFLLSRMPQLIRRPRWLWGMARTRRHNFGNFAGHLPGLHSITEIADWTLDQFCDRLTWEDVKAIRDRWPGKLILKGITHPEDAISAAEIGADTIVVSNHGGRQLDGDASTISVLPSVLAAVGDRVEVMMDGGIRSGQDVLKAVAMGAKGVMTGRATLYGLGAGGEAGVTAALEIIRKELDRSMAMCGARDIRQLDTSIFARNPFSASAA